MAKKTIIRQIKKKPKTLTRMAVKSIDFQYIGDEPVDITGKDYTVCLNWYTYSCDQEQARNWLLEYLKREDKSRYAGVLKAPKWAVPTTTGWQARMMLNGNTLPEKSQVFFNDRVAQIIATKDKEKPEESTAPKNTISIRDRTLRKSHDLLAEAESKVVDDRNSMYEFLVGNQASAPAATHLLEYYTKIADEINSSDADIKAAYGKRLSVERKFWDTLISDLNRYLGNKKVVKVRKPKAKKTKPLVDLVKNFQYQKDFPQLKIVSVNPTEIIGAQQVWTINTKYNKVTCLSALGPAGLQVKGTTIVGVDEERSWSKRASKLETISSSILKAGKVALKKIEEQIKSTKLDPVTRINTSTIILRVVR